MSAHTPGPWYILCEDECPEDIPIIEIAFGECPSKEFKSIAHVQPSVGAGDDFHLGEEDRANARLIAAAPELLEALEYQVECMRGGGDLQTFLHMRDAAIAKARGDA